MSKVYRIAQMQTALVPGPSATFSWLLGELNESSNNYRVLSIQELNPADEFLSEVERQYSLPHDWLRLPRSGRKASVASYLAQVEKMKKRKSRRGDARKGGKAHD